MGEETRSHHHHGRKEDRPRAISGTGAGGAGAEAETVVVMLRSWQRPQVTAGARPAGHMITVGREHRGEALL